MTTLVFLKHFFALLALLALAYVAAHPRIVALERRLGLTTAITSGFPFVALGLLARHPSIGVFTDDVLMQVRPLLHFALGWLGFLLGFKFETRVIEQLPRQISSVIALQTGIPFLLIILGGGGFMFVLNPTWQEALFLRDGIVLGTAGAMTSVAASQLVSRVNTTTPILFESVLHHLDEVVGVLGLMLLSAYFRPQHIVAAWELPGTAWLFLTLGIGAAVGILVYVVLQRTASRAELMAISIGSVAFAAGFASYLHISPMVVCFIAGFIVVNLQSKHRDLFHATLIELERSIYFLFLSIVGALWRPADWRGWALVIFFLVFKYGGHWLSAFITRRKFPETSPLFITTHSPSVASVSPLAIAIVVNAQVLYHDSMTPWIVTAVIGGALASEVITQVGARAISRSNPALPIEE